MERLTIPADRRSLPTGQEHIMELFKEIYKESLGSYRFYGTLRATIAWPPATLVCASGVYLLRKSDLHLLPHGEYLLPAIFSIVLGLIAYVNYQLQMLQAECMAVARKCLEYWKNALNGYQLTPHTYSELKEKIHPKKHFDTPTICF